MNNGIIYLIQPTELIGTNRYKIGCSENTELNRVKKGYKKGTRYIYIIECNDPFVLEKNIKKTFNEKFKLIAGYEYFEGDEKSMKEEFLKLTNIYSNIYINNSLIIKNNYKDIEIISKSILIEKKSKNDYIDYDDYDKYEIIKEFFEKLLYRGDIIEDFKRTRCKCTSEYYDDRINFLLKEIEERFKKDEYKICDYLMVYKNIIIQIFNKNFDEDNTELKLYCVNKSFCEFLGYYDNNYSFLTSEYIDKVIEYNCVNNIYYEIIKEPNNKYSGILLYNKRFPEFISFVSNVDLDYNYINNYYGDFYDNCQKYVNENKFIREHLEGHLDNWIFNDVSYNSLYLRNDTEFKKIIYPQIIKLSIKNEFSEKIISEIQNNKNILDEYKDNKVLKELKKYKNLQKFIKKYL